MTKTSFSACTRKTSIMTVESFIALLLLLTAFAFTYSDLPPMFCRIHVYRAAENVAMLPRISFQELYSTTTLSTIKQKNYGEFSEIACRQTIEFIGYFEKQTLLFIEGNRDFFWEQVRENHFKRSKNHQLTECFIDSLVNLGHSIHMVLTQLCKLRTSELKVLDNICIRIEASEKKQLMQKESHQLELLQFVQHHQLQSTGFADPLLSPSELSARVIQLTWRNKGKKKSERQFLYYKELIEFLLKSPSIQGNKHCE